MTFLLTNNFFPGVISTGGEILYACNVGYFLEKDFSPFLFRNNSLDKTQ